MNNKKNNEIMEDFDLVKLTINSNGILHAHFTDNLIMSLRTSKDVEVNSKQLKDCFCAVIDSLVEEIKGCKQSEESSNESA